MILVVGEAPSRARGSSHAARGDEVASREPKETGSALDERSERRSVLAGRSGERLARLCGVTLESWVDRSDRHNLIQEPAETWDRRRARRRANWLLYQFPEYAAVILCGRRVATAFGMERMAFLSSVWIDDAGRSLSPEIVVIPHPSGRSRWWNDEANVASATRVMTRLWRTYAG